MRKPMKYPVRKQQRQKEAQERNAHWASLTPEEKIASLDRRLGSGRGAKKQRLKIQREINKSKQQQPRRRKKNRG